jgi:DNA-binding FadR family transcriptional regulator
MTGELLEFDVLSILDSSSRPVGAVTLYYQLKDRHAVGQATVGRKLLELDTRGLTRKNAFSGRVITPEGRVYLAQAREAIRSQYEQKAFIDSLTAKDFESLLQVLEVRYALERSGARLAATRVTQDELDNMHSILGKHGEAIDRGENGDYEDVLFHEAVAKAAKNPVLEHSVRLVRQASGFSPIIASILAWRWREKGEAVLDLNEILNHLDAHDPDGAEAAMGRHIERMRDAAVRFWDRDAERQIADCAGKGFERIYRGGG